MKARRSLSAAVIGVMSIALTSCTGRLEAPPSCSQPRRLAIVAQALPSASYVPCLDEVPEGWSAGGFDVGRGHARFTLRSDRVNGRPVRVELLSDCGPEKAVPSTPRAEGVRTGIALRSISPRYAGTLYDVFAGGCITYQFEFPRGPHIALMDELQAMVGLVPRRQLRLDVQREVGVDIGP